MIVKMLCTFEFDPATNSYTPIGNPEIVKAQNSKVKKEESLEPELTLCESKYSLNTAAIDLLNVTAGDRIDIKYQIIDKINYPIIGPSTVWNSNSGNKLTKSGTVSYRGKANMVLSEFGDTFELSPWKGHDGLFILMGNEPSPVIEDDNVEVPVDDEIEDDLIEDTKDLIDDDDLLDLSEDTDTELKNFKFKF